MAIYTTGDYIAEIQLAGTVAAGGSNLKRVLFTFHYRPLSLTPTPVKTGLEARFQTVVATPIAAALNARFTQVANIVRWLDNATDPGVAFAETLPGLVVGDSMPMTSAAYLLLRTGLRGKWYRGSKHLGPMSEADTTTGADDIFNAAALTRLGAVASAILSSLVVPSGNTWVPVVVSREKSQVLVNPTEVQANDVQVVAVNKRVGLMRRRRVTSIY